MRNLEVKKWKKLIMSNFWVKVAWLRVFGETSGICQLSAQILTVLESWFWSLTFLMATLQALCMTLMCASVPVPIFGSLTLSGLSIRAKAPFISLLTLATKRSALLPNRWSRQSTSSKSCLLGNKFPTIKSLFSWCFFICSRSIWVFNKNEKNSKD